MRKIACQIFYESPKVKKLIELCFKFSFNGELKAILFSFLVFFVAETCDLKTEFNCGDQTCVDISLKCDGEFDCKYRYDEETTICARGEHKY